MTYQETVDYLYQLAPMFQQVGSSAYKGDLTNTLRIDERLGGAHRGYATVHVAGTNGKGSTAHTLASVLQEAGYRTGLYTSPHLLDFRERIRVNGEMVSQEFVVGFVEEHKGFFESIDPSFFEITTGLAFAYFAEEAVDVAVVETGLGGRLDCTNVVEPVVSIITNISLDHTNLLGHTLAEIAREKAGIIKKTAPVIVGEAEGVVKEVLRSESLRIRGVEPVFVSERAPIREARLRPSGGWLYDAVGYPELVGELGGLAQEKNAATVLVAIELLQEAGFRIPAEAVYGGFRQVVANTGLLGRWQVVAGSPKVVLDTGHNVGGMVYVAEQLRGEEFECLHMVFGTVEDKDLSAVLALLPVEARYYFTQASIPRALDAKVLAERAAEFGLRGDCFSSVAEALGAAGKEAGAGDLIFVGGSTFVVADALKEVSIHNQ